MNLHELSAPEPAPFPPVRSVLTYGRFDGFHAGHALFLGRLATLGSDVIIGCATDDFCKQIGQPAQMPFTARRDILVRCRHVSRVIELSSWDQRLTDIVNYDVSVLALREGPEPWECDLDAIVQVVPLPFDAPQTDWASHRKTA